MFKYLNNKWMSLKNIFKDENDINEKTIVGFASFVVMVLFAIADLLTGYMGKDLVIITLGSFGIAEAGKIFSKK